MSSAVFASALLLQKLARTILIVDDEELIRVYVRSLLERAGYFILAAPSGEAGIEIVRDHPGPIDLVLTDLQMSGMSGIELGSRVNRERPGARILIMTAACPREVSLRTGWRLIGKPFSPKELLEAVSAILESASLPHRMGPRKAEQRKAPGRSEYPENSDDAQDSSRADEA